jgi:hypothetical protein
VVELLEQIRKLQRTVSVKVKPAERAEALQLLERVVQLVVLSEYDGRVDG